jgi:lysophospholipid acyltransferase (LPLAT)-like uncharacterized protein
VSGTPPTQPILPARNSNRVVVPRKLKWRHHVAAFLIFAGLQLISWTWRCRFVDTPGVLSQPHGPMIFCLWHNRLGLSMTIWKRFGRTKIRTAGLAALISASHDGGVLARALHYFNVEAVRGSSSRRGAQAMLELTSFIERGYSVAITPDGPRGPRYVIQDGIMGLGQLTGLPILPVSAHVRWKLTLKKSWDRFQVPLPFAHCEIRIGLPVCVPRDATDPERETLKRELQERMDALTED